MSTHPESQKTGVSVIGSVAELLAHSLAIETEAAERYACLADQMEVHNNPEVAKLFRKMAEIEAMHIDHVHQLSAGVELPHIPPWEYQWQDPESPEAPHDGDAHYLMTPYHAIELALRSEQRAADFFAAVAGSQTTEEVREMATRLAEEEREHVRLLEQWLARLPRPDEDWDEDLDPPNLPD